jgi:hypothetical protein
LYRNGNLGIESSGVLNVYDTLVIYGDVNAAGGATINIADNGLLVVMGDMKMAGGIYLDNNNTTGKVVVAGNFSMSGGATVQSNNYFYLYDPSPKFNGGATVNGESRKDAGGEFKNDTDLQNEFGSLHNFVSSGSFTPLPIKLSYFRGASEGNGILLQWETYTEEHFDYFELQRSDNGIDFSTIADLDARGGYRISAYYEFKDSGVHSGVYYYRLKAVDTDGSVEYHSIISVNYQSLGERISVYPNPVTNGKLKVKSEISENEITSINVLNSEGQLVGNYIPDSFTGEIQLPQGMPRGMYILQINISGKNLVKKIWVQ